jgi:glutaredoxin-related protein
MNRLSSENVTPEALQVMQSFHSETVKEVSEAVKNNRVVVVGMALNPFVGKVRRALDEAGVSYKYLQYGGYASAWKKRLAIKLWSGWATYPQVFVEGKLVGGYQDTAHQLKLGKIKA